MRQISRWTAKHVGIGLLAGLAVAGVTACSGQDTVPEDMSAPEISAPDDLNEAAEGDAALIANGRDIVEVQCTSCHAIGADDESPRTDAPPLRTVLADYDPEALADDFREHIHVGHPDMPDFDFGPIGTDAVLAYLISIQVDG